MSGILAAEDVHRIHYKEYTITLEYVVFSMDALDLNECLLTIFQPL